MALFKKVCPRCGRRYPKNFSDCLECGSPLVDTEREAQKAEFKRYLPYIGVAIIAVGILVAVLFLVLPLIQYSVSSGQEFGTLSKTAGPSSMNVFTLNQPASNGYLQVTAMKLRDGTLSTNGKKFLLISVNLQNLGKEGSATVTSADFTLLDGAGQTYPAYSFGDRVTHEIGAGDSESHDLTFEIPRDAKDLRLKYTFPGTGDRSAQAIFFLLQ